MKDPAKLDGAKPNAAQPQSSDAAVRAEMRKRTRRSFLFAGVAAVGGYEFWRWIAHSREIDELPAPLRKVENLNAALSQHVLGTSRLAPTFPASEAVKNLKLNGDIGLDTGLILPSWRLQVVGLEQPQRYRQYVKDVNAWEYRSTNDDTSDDDSSNDDTSDAASADSSDDNETPEPGLLLTMDDIRQLPHVEMVTQMKCIEGWSEIVRWGGVRMVDFIRAYNPARAASGSSPRYMGLETPDGEYYVGLDMPSAMHPQTLLCYAINGQPLEPEHGAPLRLVTPLKYGIKHLKQIGKISFTDVRPKDYWAEQGYDWYAGH